MSFYDAIRVGASGAVDFEVERSLRFNRSDEAYLEATLGNSNLNKWTLSVWVKKPVNGEHQAILASGDSSVYTMVNFGNSDRLKFTNYPGSNAGVYITTRKFRDPSAWYHIVAIWDSGNSTAGDRIRLYVNGVRETAFDQSDNPNQNQNSVLNGNTQGGSTWGNGKHRIGRFSNYTDYTGCYYAEVNFVDGQAYDPSYFAETNADTGQWNPKKYAGSYGTNGFYLKFADNSGTTATTLGKDSSGNGNNFTLNNLVTGDSVKDTPTNNFATWNPISSKNIPTLLEGNLKNNGDNNKACNATFGVTSGKWYWEIHQLTDVSTSGYIVASGVTGYEMVNDGDVTPRLNYDTSKYSYYKVTSSGGYTQYKRYTDTNLTEVSSGGTFMGGAVLGFRLDMDAGTLKFYTNNTLVHTDSTIPTDGTVIFPMQNGTNSGVSRHNASIINFGQDGTFAGTKTAQGNTDSSGIGNFFYAVPSGHKAMCSANLPDPTIKLPNKHFDTKLFTGNGSSQTISGLNFAPDWVWLKCRNSSSQRSHILTDRIRGATKSLLLPETDAEGTFAQDLTAFTSDGFSVGSNGRVNENLKNLVAWNWNAGETDSATYTVKVVSDSGNKYRFNDFGTSAVTLDLAEGGTYTFDQSDSSMSSHPMQLSTTANGTHGGGSAYSTGVTYQLDGSTVTASAFISGFSSASSRKLIITVAASAPTLYYYCYYHSGMGGQANTNSTLGSSNFDGTIQTTVKANTTAGFSIVTYTGNGTNNATIGHGLGVAPVARIGKGRNIGSVGSAGSHWSVNHQNLNNGMNGGSSAGTVFLNLNVAQENNNHGAVGAVSATTMTLSDGSSGSVPRAHVNENNYLYIQYVFSEVAGYSKFGSYTGNGNSDGTFVFTGFRPAWVMTKRTDGGSQNWLIHDIKRDPHNVANKKLAPNSSFQENNSSYIGSSSQDTIDILSNGFKMRSNNNHTNISGGSFIYFAFAESPFKNSRAR